MKTLFPRNKISRITVWTIILAITLAGVSIQIALGIGQGYKEKVFEEINKNVSEVYALRLPSKAEEGLFFTREDRETIENIENISSASLGSLIGRFDTDKTIEFFKKRYSENYNVPQGSVYAQYEDKELWMTVFPYHVQYVEPSYFDTLGLTLQEGILPSATDKDWVVIGSDVRNWEQLELGSSISEIGFQYKKAYYKENKLNVPEYYDEVILNSENRFSGEVIGVLSWREQEEEHYRELNIGEYNRYNMSIFLPLPSDEIFAQEIHASDFYKVFGPESEDLTELGNETDFLKLRDEQGQLLQSKLIQPVPYRYIYFTITDASELDQTLQLAEKEMQLKYGTRVTAEKVSNLGGKSYQFIAESTVPIAALCYLTVMISLLIIGSLIMIHIQQELKPIGIRRSLGASEAEIEREYVKRYLGLSAIAAVVTFPISRVILPFLSNLMNVPLLINWWRTLLGMGLTLLIGPLCCLIPIYFITKIPPLSIMNNPYKRKRKLFDLRRDFMVVAFLVISVALTFATLYGVQQLHTLEESLNSAGKDLLIIESEFILNTEDFPSSYTEELLNQDIANYGLISWQTAWKNIDFSYMIYHYVSPIVFVEGAYLANANLLLVEGQWLTDSNDLVIGQDLAKKLFPKGEAIGKILYVGKGSNEIPLRVVGIIGETEPNQQFPMGSSLIIKGSTAEKYGIRGFGEFSQPQIIIKNQAYNQLVIARKMVEDWLTKQEIPLIVRQPFDDMKYVYSVEKAFLFSSYSLIFLAVLITAIGLFAFSLVRSRELSRTIATLRVLGARAGTAELTLILHTGLPFIPAGLIGALLGYTLFIKRNGMDQLLLLNQFPVILVILLEMIIVILAFWLPARRFSKRTPAEWL